jgi:hypothetical protein
MTIRIENDKLVGEITVNAQFLYNTGYESKQYPVKVIFDGADVNEMARLAIESAVIKVRKRIKTPSEAEALGKGVTLHEMATAKAPENPDAKAASLDVNALSPEVFEMLMRKAQERLANETKE